MNLALFREVARGVHYLQSGCDKVTVINQLGEMGPVCIPEPLPEFGSQQQVDACFASIAATWAMRQLMSGGALGDDWTACLFDETVGEVDLEQFQDTLPSDVKMLNRRGIAVAKLLRHNMGGMKQVLGTARGQGYAVIHSDWLDSLRAPPRLVLVR